MTPVILSLSASDGIRNAVAEVLAADTGSFEHRRFPDSESYIRVDSPVSENRVVICCTLHEPDEKLLPLVFLADTCRELGAATIGLVAPYLAYMRQDRRFNPGEAVTSRQFARLLSQHVDWLVTVDPHLHRIHDLNELYPIPSAVVHAAPAVSAWIRDNVDRPLLVGPDEESMQWVSAVADAAGAPWIVLNKERRGDRDVTVSVPEVDRWRDRTPVLVDDIISTARTMMETVGHLTRAGMAPPACIGVHAVFAGDAYQRLKASGSACVVTCNTIPHETNAIDVGPLLASAVAELG